MANTEEYIESLKKKHKHLHQTIEALEAEKAPDEVITRQKREKLALKDKIFQLSSK
jgi:hypothetical protein